MRSLLPLVCLALASCGACHECAAVMRPGDVAFDATPTSVKAGGAVTVRFTVLNEEGNRRWKACLMPQAADLTEPRNCVDVPVGSREVTVTAQEPGLSFVRVYGDHLNGRPLTNWIVAASSRVQVTE